MSSKQYINLKNFKFITVCWHKLDQYKRKGVFETMDALALLKKRSNISFEWAILGASSSEDDILLLKSRIKSLNLNTNVSLIFDKSNFVKIDYYLKSDLYIQP